MGAASGTAQAAEAGIGEVAFEAALAAIRAAERTYLRIGRVTASSDEYQDPAAFCEALTRTALDGTAFADTQARVRFFAWATDRAPRAKLLPVVACADLLAHAEARLARMYAERALGVNQNDLYAQALYDRCHPERPADPDLRGRFCSNPFDKLETLSRGEVYFCCPAWQPIPIGNLESQSAAEIWNSPAAQDIRRSILDGSYRYCSRMHCPKLTAQSLPKAADVTNREHRGFIAARQTRLERGPRRLVLNHDRSCNLSCPSCRTRLIVAGKAEQERMNQIADRVLKPLFAHARKVHITAGGDAFGSAHYRYVLRSISRERPAGLRVDLQTNGLLMAPSWDELQLDGLVDRVYVSIDATRASTYELVRRGGSFERLLDNLAFAAEKRRKGLISHVRLDFVVQTLNFREMPEAVELVRRFGFDGLKFQMIRSWNTYSPEEFAWHNIGSPDHPQFAELLEVLRDPRLRAGFVEFWGFHSVEPGALPAAS
ncbi:MAG TPA: radical SAM/SPASM domain-containing protein [Geminicoccaceae bacterium]|nr:radical SAM/SPASM domain-containing protein [Geminicoccaceae bacterium]